MFYMLLFCVTTIMKSHTNLNYPSEEEEEEEEERKTFWPSGDFLVWYFRDAF